MSIHRGEIGSSMTLQVEFVKGCAACMYVVGAGGRSITHPRWSPGSKDPWRGDWLP